MNSVANSSVNYTVSLLSIGILCFTASCSPSQSASTLPSYSPVAAAPDASPSTAPSAVATVARQVTVRVLTEQSAGSGVMLTHSQTTYVVLTCHHVIADSKGDRYTILTPDGRSHPAHRLISPSLKDLDLAVLAFDSSTPYQFVTLRSADDLDIGAPVYASGYPNYHFFPEQRLVENTRDLGIGAYQFTAGEFSMRLERSLPGGYRFGYTNEIEQGMSGGPVLDRTGQLVGINGRLKHPLQGITAYTFADGTHPSEALFQQMDALSWAIPTTGFHRLVDETLHKE